MVVSGIFGCGEKIHLISGKTMGTTYHVKIVAGRFTDMEPVSEKIEKRLKQINDSMSTYQKTSEISLFNAMTQTGQSFKISTDFYEVIKTGKKLFRLTGGAWDATIDPLVDLWGFGRSGPANEPPSPEEIRQKLQSVGFDHIVVNENRTLEKKIPAVSMDLASIAKGFAVDNIAGLLYGLEFENFLAEIGGEIYASGQKPGNELWRIGINRPDTKAAATEVYKVAQITNRGFATSGDYRNYFFSGGKLYSHIIDPRSGYPVANGIVSASVIADTCTFADGLATSLMVLGVEEGLKLVENLQGVEALIIQRTGKGDFIEYASSGFHSYFP
jgi:thiamine biosynthesis lipoprotein